MSHPQGYLQAAEAAAQLGVSPKALRLYEERGLLRPTRNGNGWRFYGPEQMATARQIVALRALGLSLGAVEAVLGGSPAALHGVLGEQRRRLQAEIERSAAQLAQLGALAARLEQGGAVATELAGLTAGAAGLSLTLPWPWAGETLLLPAGKAVTWLVGPLGSGKTRLARAITEATEGAVFLPMEERRDGAMPHNPERLQRAIGWIEDDGGRATPELTVLLSALLTDGATALVVDMVEEGLDAATQAALAAWLRRRELAMPLVLMTRSSTMLDLEAVAADEAVVFCPPNHSVPYQVVPHLGAPGFEAVASCLAVPAVRARTAGMTVVMVQARANSPG